MEFIIGIFKETVSITFFVIVMMMIIEYVNVKTKGVWTSLLKNTAWIQILLSAFLGMLPGCLGAFIVVSLYIHRLVRIGALIAALIATFGDESYIMLGLNPKQGLLLMIILLILGIGIGYIIDLFTKNKYLIPEKEPSFKIHNTEKHCSKHDDKFFSGDFKNLTSTRALLISGLVIYIIALISGFLGTHQHEPEHANHLTFGNWFNYTILCISIIALIISIIVSDHFLEEHLWGHVLKHHFLKIFLWTFGAILTIHILLNYFNLENWITDNYIWILVFALLIGIIPESGPHLLFVTLFINGTIPLSILLANSIVQDGHATLPLFAESKKSFLIVKTIKLIIGFAVGIVGYFLN